MAMVCQSRRHPGRYGYSTRVSDQLRERDTPRRLQVLMTSSDYTQYIPVGLYDLQDWLGRYVHSFATSKGLGSLWSFSPSIYVWECSGAGNILNNFGKQAERKDNEARQAASHPTSDLPGSSYSDAIHLAACSAHQVLPMSPDLPADLFTCCLTSPIETSLRHFVLQDPLKRNINTSGVDPRSRITVDMVMRIPGDLKDRRTPLGELSWIFTAVTDTIAWSSFPREIFNRLFRQDLLVAALFRNFLLAQRIMATYHCTPMSIPELPTTHNHPLWHSWDLAVDACLAQLPELLDIEAAKEAGQSSSPSFSTYRPSTFFAQHLLAFEVWLQYGGSASSHLSLRTMRSKSASHRLPPEQLPIVLQVLLSQAHRLRALILLSRFVDLGPWAVHLSLSIGIFPYVQKLLQSPATELRPVLIFIWARILAVDKSCQVDLLRDSGYNYFAQILSPYPPKGGPLIIPHANEHRAMCAFILSILCRNFPPGQTACLAIDTLDCCLTMLRQDDWLLKTWCLLCIAQLLADNDDAKALFMQNQRQNNLFVNSLKSNAVEVRAAALYAFGTLLGASSAGPKGTEGRGGGGTGAQLGISEINQQEIEARLAFACMTSVEEDASPMVRKELVVVISCVVREWRGWFVCAAWVYFEQEAGLKSAETGVVSSTDLVSDATESWVENEHWTPQERSHNLGLLSTFKMLFEGLLDLTVDPHIEVALKASTVVDYIIALLLDSAFCRVAGSAVQSIVAGRPQPHMSTRQPSTTPSDGARLSDQLYKAHQPMKRTDIEISSVESPQLKRNASFGGTLHTLAAMTGFYPQGPPEAASSPRRHRIEINTLSQPSDEASYSSPYPDASHERIVGDDHRVPSSASIGALHAQIRSRTGLSTMSRIDQSPVEARLVLKALIEEDMERLRIRRLKGTQAGGDTDGRMTNNGLARPHELGLGMVAKEVKDDLLPLRSGFFDWALDYFRVPQMKVKI